MARTKKNTMSYLGKSTAKWTADDYNRAVRALNTRISRVQKSKYSDFSKSLEEFDKAITVITNPEYVGDYNKNMITKSGKLSTSFQGFTKEEKEQAIEFIKSMLKQEDLQVPELKKTVRRRAKELGESEEKYLQDKEFWKMFREIREENEYGSEETFNAIEMSEGNESYETRKEKAKEYIDQYNKIMENDYANDDAVIADMSADEFKKKMNKGLTKKRVNERSVHNKPDYFKKE